LAKGMKIIAWVSGLLTVLLTLLYQITLAAWLLSAGITAGTVAYHFWMRLAVGGLFNWWLNNKVDCSRKWFQVGPGEQRLYHFLKVRKWKKHLPTYDPNAFDKKQHSWQEIAEAMCQSELVHETIVILSFLPIVASVWFGAMPVFAATSLFSALFDSLFVMIQRYNRPRVLKMVSAEQERAEK